MHLNDLLGDGEPKTSATSGFGQRAVDLVELLEDASSLVIGNAWPRIGHADVEVAVNSLGSHAHLTPGRELDGIADKVKQHLRESLFVARPMGRDLATSVLRASFLFCASDSVADLTVSTTLSLAYSVMFRVNCPDSILAISSTVLIRPNRCLPLERIRVSASRDFGPCAS